MAMHESATTVYIQKLNRIEFYYRMKRNLDHLIQHCPENQRLKYIKENEDFLKLFQKYLFASPLEWDEIDLPPQGSLLDYNDLVRPNQNIIPELLSALVVVKFNGGLGTRMKCNGPKCLIPVKNGLTFLDLTVQQIENLNEEFSSNVPLVLMNSFSTQECTEKVMHKYKKLKLRIYNFMQSKCPRIQAECFKLLPSSFDDEEKSAWYPPGHGDFYESFYKSGLLEKLIEEGKEYCFMSNIDNLGATVDLKILYLLSINKTETDFLMEVTKKTPADNKGGTLIHYKNNLHLLEYSQVPKDHKDDFKCTRKFNNFNTNNLWIKLSSMLKAVKQGKLSLDVIENKKSVIKNEKQLDVIQLETAAGAAIKAFDSAIGLFVPRTRFIPVKNTSDLFLLRSDIYINDNGKIMLNPARLFSEIPLINLSDEYFHDYQNIEKRFETIPNILHLQHLTVNGDVYFGKDVVLKGNVTIVANQGERIDIPRCSILHSKIITGCLRIVDF